VNVEKIKNLDSALEVLILVIKTLN